MSRPLLFDGLETGAPPPQPPVGVCGFTREEGRGRFEMSARSLRTALARSDEIIASTNAALHREELRSRYQRCAMSIAAHGFNRPVAMIGSVLRARAAGAPSTQAQLWSDIGLEELARLRDVFEALATSMLCSVSAEPCPAEPVALGPLIEGVAEPWRFVAVAKGLTFEFVPSRLVVRSHAPLLRAILDNLISNAVRHTSAGGVRIGCRRRGDDVRLDVADSGPGLTQFYEDLVCGTTFGGAQDRPGSGLAIIREACELLDHRVSVSCSIGHGTVMSLTVARDC